MAELTERLTERVVILQPVLIPDGGGGNATAWNNFASLWAEVVLPGGGEARLAAQMDSRTRCRVTIRRRLDVTGAMRISHRGKIYEILAVLPDHKDRRATALICEEVIAS